MPLFESSEAVASGHPDKLADHISDAILDACLEKDPFSRVAVETLVSHNLISIGGEISSKASPDLEKIVRTVISKAGYDSPTFGDLLSHFRFISSVSPQSPDISQALLQDNQLAAGDQGMMYGYACDDTPAFMPRSYEIAREIVGTIQKMRTVYPFLGPDGKVQVSISPTKDFSGSTVVSWQHAAEASLENVRITLKTIVEKVCTKYNFHPDRLLLNPSGRFVLGGPFADTGLTGRKQIIDSYGGNVLHGGGAYSGKDATKVDRSGAYMARYVAKHIVASKAAKKCLVQLIFSIGKKEPLHIGIDCFGTQTVTLAHLEKAILETFDFSVGGIIENLKLRTPCFAKTVTLGHFGREGFRWEELDRLDLLKLNLPT